MMAKMYFWRMFMVVASSGGVRMVESDRSDRRA